MSLHRRILGKGACFVGRASHDSNHAYRNVDLDVIARAGCDGVKQLVRWVWPRCNI